MPAIFADQRLGKARFHRFKHKTTKSTLKKIVALFRAESTCLKGVRTQIGRYHRDFSCSPHHLAAGDAAGAAAPPGAAGVAAAGFAGATGAVAAGGD
jgi:hypothetical protein